MIKRYPFEKLAHRNVNGWLDTRYHFSFNDYHDPSRMGFGILRVVNDDIVKPGFGFGMHPHRNMEIITYVRAGAISHKDSLGNQGRTEAGDVQVMSAGTGVRHAEDNREDVETTLFQIWIEPREKDVAPRWDSASFPKEPVNDRLSLLVSGRAEDEGKGALYIHADAAIYGGRLNQNAVVTQNLHNKAYLLVSDGAVTTNAQTFAKGDGAEINGHDSVTFTAGPEGAEILLIDLN